MISQGYEFHVWDVNFLKCVCLKLNNSDLGAFAELFWTTEFTTTMLMDYDEALHKQKHKELLVIASFVISSPIRL